MPRFYFHLRNGQGDVPDDEGIDLADQSAARAIALESVRSMVAEDVRQGVIDLDGRITIADDAGNALLTVEFREAFVLRLPGVRAPS